MKTLLAKFTLLLICTASIHAQDKQANKASSSAIQETQEWQQIIPAQKQFTILFPVKPQYKSEPTAATNEQTALESYSYDPKTKGTNVFTCGIIYTTMPPKLANHLTLNTVVNGMKKNILRHPASSIKETPISLNLCQGSELSGQDSEDGEVRMRVYVTATSFYTTYFASKNAEQMQSKGKRFLDSFKLNSPVCVPTSISENRSEAWKEFSSEERGFSVLMPGVPKEKSTSENENGKEAKQYSAILNTGWAVYSVSVRHMSRPLNSPSLIKKALDLASSYALESEQGKLISEADINLGTNIGREYKAEIKGMIMENRMYLINQRFYQLSFLMPKLENASQQDKDFYSRTASKFLDSFKLLPAVQEK